MKYKDLKWHLEPDDPSDPKQVELCEETTKQLSAFLDKGIEIPQEMLINALCEAS